MRALRLLCVLTLLAFAVPAGAEGCVPSSTTPFLDTGETPEGRYYIVADDCSHWCTGQFIWWVYEESNGIDGLQRGDEVVDDTCGGVIGGDTIVW